jgi:MoaA/NifB/PqqE/SkfB family radical SAM enzyme
VGYRRIILVTNASLIAAGGNLDRLVAAGVDVVGFSLDAADRELSRALWRRDAYPQVLDGVRHLMAREDLALASISVLTRLNMAALPDLVRLLAELARPRKGLYLPTIDFVMPEENAWAERNELVPRLSEAAPHLRRALDEAARLGLPVAYRGVPACVMRSHLDHDLERYMSIFQMVEIDGRLVHHRASLDLFRHKPPTCRSCRHDRTCVGVYRAYAHLYGTEELEPQPRGAGE